MSLTSVLDEVRKEFTVSDKYLDELVDNFVTEAAKGLEKDLPRGIPMIPTFVTKLPDGSEKGLYLAADLGGSNFRVCSVYLNGDGTHRLKQMKWKVPTERMRGTASDFWHYLTDCTIQFLDAHHPEMAKVVCSPEDNLKMGFTFSFPVHQTGINRGKLIRWTKGYDIKDAVGTDVAEGYQKALWERKVPVIVSAVVNDTTGCLLARSYETGPTSQTLIGSILGTGTNAAYSEKISAIKKLKDYGPEVHVPENAKIMVVNTEWGSFDNDVKFLPNTKYDKAINLDTPNPNFHMFEKRVSGMFLGEITRRVLEDVLKSDKMFKTIKARIAENAPIYVPWSTDTGFVSRNAADVSDDLEVVNQELSDIGITESTLEERKAVKEIGHIIALRSARLVAGIIAGLLKMTKAFEKFKVVDLGVDGAVIEFYPQFEEMMRDAWRSISFVGDKEKRITLGISRDGSGIGAALCAALA